MPSVLRKIITWGSRIRKLSKNPSWNLLLYALIRRAPTSDCRHSSKNGVIGNFDSLMPLNLPKTRLSIQIENVRRKCCERPYSTISSMASVLNKPPYEPRSSPGYIAERAECAHLCALNRRIQRRLCRNLNRSEPHVSRPLHPAGRRFVRGGSQQHPVLRREAQSALQLLWRSWHMLVPCANVFLGDGPA